MAGASRSPGNLEGSRCQGAGNQKAEHTVPGGMALGSSTGGFWIFPCLLKLGSRWQQCAFPDSRPLSCWGNSTFLSFQRATKVCFRVLGASTVLQREHGGLRSCPRWSRSPFLLRCERGQSVRTFESIRGCKREPALASILRLLGLSAGRGSILSVLMGPGVEVDTVGFGVWLCGLSSWQLVAPATSFFLAFRAEIKCSEQPGWWQGNRLNSPLLLFSSAGTRK